MPNVPSTAKRGEVCLRCGVIHPGCLGHAFTTGAACRMQRIKGADVCRRHGGSAPQVREAGRRRLAEAAITRQLHEQGVEAITNPLEAFQRLVEETVAFKDLLAARVAAIEEWRFEDEKGGEQLRSEVALLERAWDRAGKFLGEWVKLGLDERLVQIREQEVALVRTALTRLWDDPELGLTDEQREKAPTLTARHLRVLESKTASA